jgi:hypothetical protein
MQFDGSDSHEYLRLMVRISYDEGRVSAPFHAIDGLTGDFSNVVRHGTFLNLSLDCSSTSTSLSSQIVDYLKPVMDESLRTSIDEMH